MKKYFWLIAIAAAVLSGCKSKNETETQSFNIDTKAVALTDGEEGSKEVALRCENVVPTVTSNASEWLTADITARMLTIKFTRNETGAERSGILTITPGKLDKVDVVVSQPAYVPPAPPAPDDLKVGDKTEDGLGVIYWVDQTNRQIAKAISLSRANNTAWSTLVEESGAVSRVNGAANTKIMAGKEGAQAAYPAAYFCANLGEGWYVPALNELLEIYDIYNGVSHLDAAAATPDALTAEEKAARATFDGWLSAAGGDAMNTAESGNGQSYWSSTEYNDTYPYYVRFGKFAIGGEDQDVKKSSAKEQRYVRCMKVIGAYEYPVEPPTLSLKPATLNFNGGADSKEVAATVANGKISEVVSSDEGWCTASVSGETITVKVTDNTTGDSRIATVYVTVKGEKEELTKQIAVNQKPLGGFKVGDLYKEGEKVVGVVFWTSDDAQTAKIVSLGRNSEAVNWAEPDTAPATELIGATDEEDGSANMAAIKAYIEKTDGVTEATFPMLAYLKTLGDGWYIPARKELVKLFETYNGTTLSGSTNAVPSGITDAEKASRAAFEKLLTDNGGTALNTAESGNGDQYFSSTEYKDNPSIAYCFRFGKRYDSAEATKVNTRSDRYFRAIRVVKAK